MMDILNSLGAFGLLLIIVGVISENRKKQDLLYIFGGIFLGIYSISRGDIIFITLQIIFTIAAVYDLIKLQK